MDHNDFVGLNCATLHRHQSSLARPSSWDRSPLPSFLGHELSIITHLLSMISTYSFDNEWNPSPSLILKGSANLICLVHLGVPRSWAMDERASWVVSSYIHFHLLQHWLKFNDRTASSVHAPCPRPKAQATQASREARSKRQARSNRRLSYYTLELNIYR